MNRSSEQGLWSFRSVWFSRFGNLLQTAQAFVHHFGAGYGAAELKDILQVKTKHALTQYETAGDPDSGCKWTRKTTDKIARVLKRMGIRICDKQMTVVS